MTPRPPVAGAIKAEVLWTQSGVPAANILHVGYSSAPPSSADLTSLAEAISGALQSELQSHLINEVTCVGVVCTDLSSDTAHVGSYETPWTGTDTVSNSLSAGSSAMIVWQIARRYRGGKPRTYLPAFGAGHASSMSVWGSTAVGWISSAAAGLLLACVGTFGSLIADGLVCVSYVSGNAPRVTPLVESVTGYISSSLIRTQRRRIQSSSF